MAENIENRRIDALKKLKEYAEGKKEYKMWFMGQNTPNATLFLPKPEPKWERIINKQQILLPRVKQKQLLLPRYTIPLGAPELSTREIIKKYSNKVTTGIKKVTSSKLFRGSLALAGLELATSVINPLLSTAGTFIGGQLRNVDNLTNRFNNRPLEFGGKIHQSFMEGTAMTERTRALSELQRSRSNARTFMGNEASLYHS